MTPRVPALGLLALACALAVPILAAADTMGVNPDTGASCRVQLTPPETLGPKITLERVGDLAEQVDITNQLASDVLVGLSAQMRKIPSVYHYDDTGSALYSEITELDEYYPTRTEQSIMEANKDDIAVFASGLDVSDIPHPFHLVELGAGDGRKTRVLLNHFISRKLPFDYVSVDISEGALRDQAKRLAASDVDLSEESSMSGVRLLTADNIQGIRTLRHSQSRVLVMFLGSSVGNMYDDEIVEWLGKVWQVLRHGDMLYIGFDLRKDPAVISRAYNDSHGITAAFNLNILERLNSQLAGNFSTPDWQFFSWYNAFNGHVTSVLQARRDNRVTLGKLRRSFDFEATDTIETEISRKFRLTDIERYASNSGFDVVRHFLDEKRWFVDSLWRVNKLRSK